METHPIEGLMKSTLENLKDMIDVNTIVGDPIETVDGTLIIPISSLSLGFASGGSEFEQKAQNNSNTKYPFGGGAGSGITVKPVAFLVIKEDCIRLLPVDQKNTYDRIVDGVPQIIDILKNSFSQKSSDKNKDDITVEEE
ncbi:GerW family sporulation protein [Clostridium ganghwense]|uniref:GerW family sporulation protein n=1 Tax=Clostridium ganghwense TaxID=312089 RepID=A0ABT4CML4_9CLOT|nr:GerW family sporulation protein [Clostridium ganghwense]MCY6370294.1 GerW family sporulation protein [Clostridium ganghwense]